MFGELHAAEYLKREYDIDVRGLDGNLQSLKISEVLAMVRMEVAGMKSWTVTDDVFLSTFGFSRYKMWKDLRKNIGEFSKNKLVAAMLANKPLTKKKTKRRKKPKTKRRPPKCLCLYGRTLRSGKR